MPDEIQPKETKQFTPPNVPKPGGITPTQAETKEPPKEVLERTFTLDPSLLSDNSKGTVTIEDNHGVVSTQKVGETKEKEIEQKKEEKKEERPRSEDGKFVSKDESSKGEPTEKKEEKKDESVKSILKPPTEQKKEDKKDSGQKETKVSTEPKFISPEGKQKITRNYEGHSEEEVKMFKQMSDDAYAFTSRLLKDKKELEKNKADAFLNHPQAFVLTPEFEQVNSQLYFTEVEGRCWQAAMKLCKEGKAFKPIVGWNQDGSPKFSDQEVQPDAEIEEKIRLNIMKCDSKASELQNNKQNLTTGFQSRLKTDLGLIQEERAKRFAWVKDPKFLDWTLDMGSDGGEMKISDIRESFKDLIPSYMRSHIASEVAADLFVALRIQDAELQQLKSQIQTQETIQKDEKRGEPTSEIRETEDKITVGNGKVKEFSLKGMPQ